MQNMQIVRPATNPDPYVVSFYAHVAMLPRESYQRIHTWSTQDREHHGSKKGEKNRSGTKEAGVSQVSSRREGVCRWCRLVWGVQTKSTQSNLNQTFVLRGENLQDTQIFWGGKIPIASDVYRLKPSRWPSSCNWRGRREYSCGLLIDITLFRAFAYLAAFLLGGSHSSVLLSWSSLSTAPGSTSGAIPFCVCLFGEIASSPIPRKLQDWSRILLIRILISFFPHEKCCGGYFPWLDAQ